MQYNECSTLLHQRWQLYHITYLANTLYLWYEKIASLEHTEEQKTEDTVSQ